MSAAWPEGVERLILEEAGSTNDEAARLLAEGGGAAWVMARRQVAGRGRQGRAWADPPGNFAATLAMPSSEGPAGLALRSFVAALALREALQAVTGLAGTGPDARLALKWPNDVLLDGGKVAGILLETRGRPYPGLLVGIGVNLVAAPPPDVLEEGALPPVSLAAAAGVRVTPEAVLDALAPAFARRDLVLIERGFGPLRAEWLENAAHLGRPIRARLPGMVLEGLFEGLDEDGQLLLRIDGALRPIPAAEVQFA
ncbi:MAG: biotin--[acetyl-CoA-carboxylase] ligase [Rhodobacteraceae bacterium]|nr:biotin--[acetyl-CoA-carboxylase] ligase [Paracoccaceae bacterium]